LVGGGDFDSEIGRTESKAPRRPPDSLAHADNNTLDLTIESFESAKTFDQRADSLIKDLRLEGRSGAHVLRSSKSFQRITTKDELVRDIEPLKNAGASPTFFNQASRTFVGAAWATSVNQVTPTILVGGSQQQQN